LGFIILKLVAPHRRAVSGQGVGVVSFDKPRRFENCVIDFDHLSIVLAEPDIGLKFHACQFSDKAIYERSGALCVTVPKRRCNCCPQGEPFAILRKPQD